MCFHSEIYQKLNALTFHETSNIFCIYVYQHYKYYLPNFINGSTVCAKIKTIANLFSRQKVIFLYIDCIVHLYGFLLMAIKSSIIQFFVSSSFLLYNRLFSKILWFSVHTSMFISNDVIQFYFTLNYIYVLLLYMLQEPFEHELSLYRKN